MACQDELRAQDVKLRRKIQHFFAYFLKALQVFVGQFVEGRAFNKLRYSFKNLRHSHFRPGAFAFRPLFGLLQFAMSERWFCWKRFWRNCQGSLIGTKWKIQLEFLPGTSLNFL